ncbi:MAG: hypothetical protein IPH13_07900 [Planctomycetes bacterium]|nr:hypothetical protein [Planctomycetota bacterium]MCC7170671.1 hypothetical protein [Planctomycetota bacterium]
MNRNVLVWLVGSALVLPVAFGAGTPLLEKADRKPILEAMTKYQQAYLDKFHDAKALKELPNNYADLKKKLEEAAKRKKVDSLLASPADMRLLFAVPVRPDASPKKDAYYDQEFLFDDGQTKEKLKYLLRVPKSYAAGEPLPILLVLHPPLKRADEVKKWVTATIPATVAEQSIVLVPLNVDNPVDWSSSLGHIRSIVPFNPTWTKLWVDRARVIVFGSGASAPAAVDYATFFPGLFAGAIVSHPSAAPTVTKLATARYLPMLCLAQAAGDTGQIASSFTEEMKKAGGTANVVTAEVDATGAIDAAGQEALTKFIADTRKDVAPKKVTLVTDSDACVNAYWFRVDNVDVKPGEFARMDAEIDSATNEIRVTTPSTVRGFHIYLNDELVDMGKTIKVIHVVAGKDDAKVVFEGTKSRSLDKAVELWMNAAHGNFGESYTNAIDITIAP